MPTRPSTTGEAGLAALEERHQALAGVVAGHDGAHLLEHRVAGEGCGYSNIDGSYIPCSGDNVCANEFESGSCVTPSGASPCPVPEDPLAGG